MASSARIHRFDFNSLRDFRGPAPVRAPIETVEAPPPPLPPVYSQAEIDAALHDGKKLGYSEGFAAGQSAAAQAIDAKTERANEIIANLHEAIGELPARYTALIAEESRALSGLVLAIARKVVSAQTAQAAAPMIEALVNQCLPIVFSKPRLSIELAPEMLEPTLERIEAQLAREGFEGELQVKPNPDMPPGDIKLDWGHGQMTRSSEQLWQSIEAIIAASPIHTTLPEAPLPTASATPIEPQ